MTPSLQLYGTPNCRRYQRMRANVLQAISQADETYELLEINDSERLSKHNPLSLPKLMQHGKTLAAGNPISVEKLFDELYG